MSQRKQGFSLVEVMLLFTVLAVVLAAAIPMISTKSRPVPNKINHGVYRCINTDNGLIEELYTGTRRVKPDAGQSPYVNKCSFRVPSAALYRIDMYSAGAGGTKFAKFTSQLDDYRDAKFNVDGYSDFKYSDEENGPEYEGENPVLRLSGNKEDTLIKKLSSQEIMNAFSNDYLYRYQYTGNAGKGGDAEIKNYPSPMSSKCAAIEQQLSKAYADYDNAVNDLTNNSDLQNYKANLTAQEQAKRISEEKKTEANNNYQRLVVLEALRRKLRDFITGYLVEENWNYLSFSILNDFYNTYYTEGVGIQVNASSYLGNIKTAVENNAAYNRYYEIVETAKNNRNNAYIIYKQNEGTIQDNTKGYDYNDATSGLTNTIITELYKDYGWDRHGFRVPDFFIVKGRQNNTYDYSQYFYNANYSVEYYKSDITNPYDTAAMGRVLSKIKENKDYDIEAEFKACLTGTQQKNLHVPGVEYKDSSYIQKQMLYLQRESQTALNKILEEISDLIGENVINDTYPDNKIADGIRRLAREVSDANTNDSTVDNNLRDARTLVETKEGELRTAVAKLESAKDDAVAGKLENILKNPYNETDMFDNTSDKNTLNQLADYCKARYQSESYDGVQASTGLIPQTRDTKQEGGAGGRGEYLRVKIPIIFKPVKGQEANYKPEQYLRNLLVPYGNDAIFPVECSGLSGEFGTNCQAISDPDRDLSGLLDSPLVTTDKYNVDKYNTSIIKTSGTTRKLDTKDGLKIEQLAKPYVAWSIPEYDNNGVRKPGGRKVISLTKTLPTPGKGAILKVDEQPKGTYTQLNNMQLQRLQGKSAEELKDAIFQKNYAYEMSLSSQAGNPITFTHPSLEKYLYDGIGSSKIIIDHDSLENFVNKPLYKDIYLEIHSGLWTKTYKIGRAGKPGKHASFMAASLGANCTFEVPAPGEPFDYYGTQNVYQMEDALKVRMVCRNKKENVVFERELEGGTYNLKTDWPQDVTAKFYYTQNQSNFTIPGEVSEVQQWYPTSMWAKVYNQIMGQGAAYDLNKYRVAAGGDGTTVVDSCIEPKGYYFTEKYYLYKYYNPNAENDDEKFKEQIAIPGDYRGGSLYKKKYDGIKNGKSCYGTPATPNANSVEDYVVSDDDSDISVEAGYGGGGAVVITW